MPECQRSRQTFEHGVWAICVGQQLRASARDEHGKVPRAAQPRHAGLASGVGTVQREQRVPVAGDAVAEARPLRGQKSAPPDHLSQLCRHGQVRRLSERASELQQQRHQACGAVAPVHQAVLGAPLGGGQVAAKEALREQRVGGGPDELDGPLAPRQLLRELQEREENAGETVGPSEVALVMPLVVQGPAAMRGVAPRGHYVRHDPRRHLRH
mmetsp:Transcript_2153/g.6844  ORF Transcript_2153/g.6844 Transcript_2153/m.6844 type:complete len:212 (-) Transcript_2153:343-978(-)